MEAIVICMDVSLSCLGLIQQGSDTDAVGISLGKDTLEVAQGHTAVQNILNDQKIITLQLLIQILDNFYNAGSLNTGAIAGNRPKVDSCRNGNCAHQVCHK